MMSLKIAFALIAVFWIGGDWARAASPVCDFEFMQNQSGRYSCSSVPQLGVRYESCCLGITIQTKDDRETTCSQLYNEVLQYCSDKLTLDEYCPLFPDDDKCANFASLRRNRFQKKTKDESSIIARNACDAIRSENGDNKSAITQFNMAKACSNTLDHCLIPADNIIAQQSRTEWFPGFAVDPLFGRPKNDKFSNSWCVQAEYEQRIRASELIPDKCEIYLSQKIRRSGKVLIKGKCFPYNSKDENLGTLGDKVRGFFDSQFGKSQSTQ